MIVIINNDSVVHHTDGSYSISGDLLVEHHTDKDSFIKDTKTLDNNRLRISDSLKNRGFNMYGVNGRGALKYIIFDTDEDIDFIQLGMYSDSMMNFYKERVMSIVRNIKIDELL